MTGSVGCGHGQASDTPADYLRLYRQAGQKYGIPWQVLAGIGKAGSDHGRGAGAGTRDGANRAGAMGPMRFLGSTWAVYGVRRARLGHA
ncbi:hypothetical protein GCM10010116_40770 [Microbispora rosea subsp. aerata]|nr:hypothetical protein [Microbispora rosea]GGO20339.1 hypothetical protein GCM10010116_40770 [Microbispora rosea subsp. aerata]GIH57186.1 hypothetical protein Mro02_41000 [Microbispora rosea subsp. aerata]GLJ84744.1 hypothetical protein GCM10017588_34720 [Microbispora rosea subsp. aerata]